MILCNLDNKKNVQFLKYFLGLQAVLFWSKLNENAVSLVLICVIRDVIKTFHVTSE